MRKTSIYVAMIEKVSVLAYIM